MPWCRNGWINKDLGVRRFSWDVAQIPSFALYQGLIVWFMRSSRSSKGMKALFIELIVIHLTVSHVQPNAPQVAANSSVSVVALIRRLSVFIVTRKDICVSSPIGCSDNETAAPVCTFDVGQISSGILRSLTYEASRPSCAGPVEQTSMSSTTLTPWPSRSAPQY